jgi:DNA-binding MarR family transcriptional regulator
MAMASAGAREQAGSQDAPPISGAAIVGLVRHVEVALAELELSVSQYRLLIYLSVAPSIPSDLANRLEVRRPTITALADGLVERGLVSREPDEQDRRRVRHLLTDAGRDTLRRASELVDERLRRVADHLDDDDAATALHGLELWTAALGRHWRAST